MTKVLYIICEGETEEAFAKEVLKHHFALKDIHIKPINLGGLGNQYPKLVKAITAAIDGSKDAYVTTMTDLCDTGDTFPDFAESGSCKGAQRAEFMESTLSDSIKKLRPNARFIPYYQCYEFEALLFADTNILFEKLKPKGLKLASIEKIVKACGSPEEINSGSTTSPSERIVSLLGNNRYSKNIDGLIVAKAIALEKMRKECPHFDSWISKLEKI